MEVEFLDLVVKKQKTKFPIPISSEVLKFSFLFKILEKLEQGKTEVLKFSHGLLLTLLFILE